MPYALLGPWRMTVTDKRADIAILRTLGSSPKSIMALASLIGSKKDEPGASAIQAGVGYTF